MSAAALLRAAVQRLMSAAVSHTAEVTVRRQDIELLLTLWQEKVNRG